jgi:hypothetical protein
LRGEGRGIDGGDEGEGMRQQKQQKMGGLDEWLMNGAKRKGKAEVGELVGS